MSDKSIHVPHELQRLLGDLDARPDPVFQDVLSRTWQTSPFLRGLMRRGDALGAFLGDGPDAMIARALAEAGKGTAASAATLRQAKADVALATALADLSGVYALEQVTEALSGLADRAIDSAIRIAVDERVSGAPPDGFCAIALGKLGSGELNYSSDVDLIFLFDGSRLARREADEPETAAVRIGRRVVDLLQTRDSNGYVFRVDLRLRPNSEVSPTAIPVGAAEVYYQSEALAWERAAYIRARVVGGDVAMGEEFLKQIQPFIWRRSLDYTAIRDIQDMSLRIRDHFDDRQKIGAGYDLKRGRGGIREVEFFAQIHQLIFGGRDVSLRKPATLQALQALCDAGRLDEKSTKILADAYRFLRTAEHRVQMMEDAQTHQIPARAPDRKALAVLAGYKGWPDMERDLKRHSAAVGGLYDELIAEAETRRLPRQKKALEARLKALGVGPFADLAALITTWRGRPCQSLRSDAAQREFEIALPRLAEAFGKAKVKRPTLLRFDDFLKALPSSIQFFALIEANPALAGLIARVMDMVPLLATKLARHPENLDIMLSGASFERLGEVDDLVDELVHLTGRQDALEYKLDEVRRWVAERRFQLGVQLIEGQTDPLRVARDYARLADAAVTVLANAVTADFESVHGSVPGGRLAIVGLGRFGGNMLTEQSDLDLVYLFSGPYETQSDGKKPLPATSYFNRLSQRLTGALSVQTAAGPLYEIDTRLRPSGAQGLLAVNLETFARYQMEEAWTWEHMALTRARVVIGDPGDRAGIEAGIKAALTKPRDAIRLKNEVLEMRSDIAAAHSAGGLWDMKHAPGGLIDLEFMVQYLQLSTQQGFSNDLRTAISHFVETGVIDAALLDAHDLMTRLLVTLRLVDASDPKAMSDAVKAMLAGHAGVSDFAALKVALGQAKMAVQTGWSQIFGQKRKG